MARVEWTPAAESDFEEILFYIAAKDRRREVAKKIYAEIKSKCELYAENPELGLNRSDLCTTTQDKFRSFTFKRWIVIYEPRDFGIEVFAVLDGSRLYESFFRRPGDSDE